MEVDKKMEDWTFSSILIRSTFIFLFFILLETKDVFIMVKKKHKKDEESFPQ